MTPTTSQPSGSPAIPDGVRPRFQVESNGTGLFMSSDHRYWFNGEGPLPSVTTILRVLDKPALTWWYKQQVALAAYDRVGEWQTLGREEAIKWLMSMPDATRDNAASIGSSVHLLADMESRGAEGFPIPEGTQPYLDAFKGFLGRPDAPQVVSSEKAVLNLSEGYAGTYDLLCQIAGELWLLDVKTGKNAYPDYALQLAAYGMAEHIALPGNPTLYPFPEPARYGILHLRPDKYPDTGYQLIEYAITDRERLAFLATLELWRWMKDSK